MFLTRAARVRHGRESYYAHARAQLDQHTVRPTAFGHALETDLRKCWQWASSSYTTNRSSIFEAKGEWLRSPVALAPSYARHYLVGGVHPNRGRYLAHDPDWRMSAATGPWRRCNLTERQESRGQRFAPALRERSLGTDRGTRPRVRPLRRRSAKIRSKATHGPAKVLVPQGESSLS